MVTLLPEPQQAATLSKICAATPTTRPRSFWRGTYQRYCYLQAPEGLQSIGSGLLQLKLTAQTPLTTEKKALITSLQIAIEQEGGRIRILRQPLWRLFHRSSLRFFDAWQTGLNQASDYLETLNLSQTAPPSGASTQQLQQLLASPAHVLAETQTAVVTPAPALLPPLSSKTQAYIERIRLPYNNLLTLQERAQFDTWQQRHLGGSIWDTHGILRPGLTESEGGAILEAWTDIACQRAEKRIAAAEARLNDKIQAMRLRN